MPYILFAENCQGHIEFSLLTKFSKLGVGLGWGRTRPDPLFIQTNPWAGPNNYEPFSDFRTHSKRCLKTMVSTSRYSTMNLNKCKITSNEIWDHKTLTWNTNKSPWINVWCQDISWHEFSSLSLPFYLEIKNFKVFICTEISFFPQTVEIVEGNWPLGYPLWNVIYQNEDGISQWRQIILKRDIPSRKSRTSRSAWKIRQWINVCTFFSIRFSVYVLGHFQNKSMMNLQWQSQDYHFDQFPSKTCYLNEIE